MDSKKRKRYTGFNEALPSSSAYASLPNTKGNATKAYPTASLKGQSSQSSASTSIPSSSSRPAKRSRKKKKDEDGPEPEKRAARFKPACPQAILERVNRVLTQRFFMIDRHRSGDELREEFSVLGSTGNVYTVIIDKTPTCNCPDAIKGNHCKHILFIYLKVLQVPQSSGLWYQKALLSAELETIFANAPLAPNSIAHSQIREAHAKAMGKITAFEASKRVEPSNKRIPGPDDDCPICYECMHKVKEAALVFCGECGNALHRECFRQWRASNVHSGKNLTCVYCRATWVARTDASISKGSRISEGYLNLSDIAGISPVRDTSTYYHGRRRGYSSYDDDLLN